MLSISHGQLRIHKGRFIQTFGCPPSTFTKQEHKYLHTRSNTETSATPIPSFPSGSRFPSVLRAASGYWCSRTMNVEPAAAAAAARYFFFLLCPLSLSLTSLRAMATLSAACWPCSKRLSAADSMSGTCSAQPSERVSTSQVRLCDLERQDLHKRRSKHLRPS